MTVKELYDALSRRIPTSLSCEWDRDGLCVCADGDAEVRRVLCVLDVTDGAISYAKEQGFDVILAHHPLIFRPLFGITDGNVTGKRALKLLGSGISAMCFHTRADAVTGGVGMRLAQALGLADIKCHDELSAMLYTGKTEKPMSPERFAEYIKQRLGAVCVVYSSAGRDIVNVAVLGGAGKEFASSAAALGADAYVTGELPHDLLCDASEMGISLFAAGHYATEYPVCGFFADAVHDICPDIYVEQKRFEVSSVC